MTEIALDDLEDIARGAAILGSGGGGNPYYGRLFAEHALGHLGRVTIDSLSELPDDAMVIPVGKIGAPTIGVEKPPAGTEFPRLISVLEATLDVTATHVGCMEVGGGNSLLPIAAAAMTGLPLVDADGMGRAFPELHMTMATVHEVPACPLALGDERGNTLVLDAIDNRWAERLARAATTELGATACLACFPMTGVQARTSLIPGTLTLAAHLGRLIANARARHADPAQAVVDDQGGAVLCRGTIMDVHRETTGGFTRGSATITDAGAHVGTLEFQNEFLVYHHSGRSVRASVPDLICVLDVETGDPITTDILRYGLRATVIGLPCHHRWRTPAALDLVGPHRFGYTHEYTPIEDNR